MARFDFLLVATVLLLINFALAQDSPVSAPSPVQVPDFEPADSSPALVPASQPETAFSPPSPPPAEAPEISSFSPAKSPEISSPPAPAPVPTAPAPPPSEPPVSPSEEPDAPAPSPVTDGEPSEISDLSADEGSKTEKGMSGGKKFGVAFGVLAGAGLVGLGVFVYRKRQENIKRARYSYAAREFL